MRPLTQIKINLGALKLQSEIERLGRNEVSSVTYCARDGCCWHDDQPVPGDEGWPGRDAAPRGARIGLLLNLDLDDDSYGTITVFRDDVKLGQLSARELLETTSSRAPLFWTASVSDEGDIK